MENHPAPLDRMPLRHADDHLFAEAPLQHREAEAESYSRRQWKHKANAVPYLAVRSGPDHPRLVFRGPVPRGRPGDARHCSRAATACSAAYGGDVHTCLMIVCMPQADGACHVSRCRWIASCGPSTDGHAIGGHPTAAWQGSALLPPAEEITASRG